MPEGWTDRRTTQTADPAEALHSIKDPEDVTGKEKLLRAEPADKSHLHSALCSPSQLFFGIFIPPARPRHTHVPARTHAEDGEARLNFLLQGHAVKEDKVVSMYRSSYLC